MNIFLNNGNNDKLRNLKWFDILIVTVILFGQAIYTSTISFFSLSNQSLADSVEFSQTDNWQQLFTQLVFLLIAFVYLRLRNFDFTQWKFRFTPKAIFFGVLMFIGAALLFDFYYMILGYLFPNLWGAASSTDVNESVSFLATLSNVSLSLVLYALLNGFYEEIFFLGICLSVEPKKVVWAFIYSLIIRYSFHTYQGKITALGIGLLLGTIYYLIYVKTERKNLVPFFIAHAIADVFGLGILNYFMS